MKTPTPSQALHRGRAVIRALAVRHRTANPRVFGSVLEGRDGADSDLDILVETTPETTLFDLGGLQDALEEAPARPGGCERPFSTCRPTSAPRVLEQAVPV